MGRVKNNLTSLLFMILNDGQSTILYIEKLYTSALAQLPLPQSPTHQLNWQTSPVLSVMRIDSA